MLLQEYLNDTHEFASPEQWGVVQSNIPQQWIEQALQMTGEPRCASGDCPWSRHFGWYWAWPCLETGSHRERGRGTGAGCLAAQRTHPSALSQARQRLGSPVQWLFRHTLPIGRTSRPAIATAGKVCAVPHWMAWSGVPRHTRQPPALCQLPAQPRRPPKSLPPGAHGLFARCQSSPIGRCQPGMPTTPRSTHWLNACGRSCRLTPLVIVDKGFYSAVCCGRCNTARDVTGDPWHPGLQGRGGANAWPLAMWSLR